MHKRILSNITNKHKTIKDDDIKNTIDNNNIKNTIDNNNNINIVDNNIDNLHISITNNTAHLSLEEKKFIDIRNLNDSLSLTMYNQHIKDVIEYNLLLEDRKYSIIKVDHKLSDNKDNNKNNNNNNNVNGNRDINKDINNNTNTKNNINNKEYIDYNYIYMQPEITWAMRNSLIDYLIDIHWSLNLTPETLYLTVNIIDRFLSKKIVSVSKLQPLGITALFIASKYEEVSTITIDSILNICYKEYNDKDNDKDNGLGGKMNNNDTTNNDISYNDIIKYEKYILHVLNYNINIPPALSFLRLCSKANNYDIKTRTIAKYLLELTLVSNIFLKYKLSIRATAAFSLACKILQEKENKNSTENNAESNKDTENNNNNNNNNDNKGIENKGNIPLSNITNNNKDIDNDNNNKGNSKTIENNKNN
ncbi:Cyclin, partial [Spraguea lophii 42_110]